MMDQRSLLIGVLVVLVALLLVLVARRHWRSWRAGHRARRAARGEAFAERLLRRRGFTIEERQKTLHWQITVDGEPHDCLLRADLLVHRNGRRYVAEVKTGEQAPRPDNVSTRRQLLEYLIAYRADGVLLVAPELGRVIELDFPVGSFGEV